MSRQKLSNKIKKKFKKKLVDDKDIKRRYKIDNKNVEFRLYNSEGDSIGDVDIGFKSEKNNDLLLIELEIGQAHPVGNTVKVLYYIEDNESKENIKFFQFFSPRHKKNSGRGRVIGYIDKKLNEIPNVDYKQYDIRHDLTYQQFRKLNDQDIDHFIDDMLKFVKDNL